MHQQAPEISIVVPVYNVGATLLTACIESALGQTFSNIEIILVNDASTDGSGAICDAFAATDPRVKAIHLPHNTGLSGARNAGTSVARGRYISYLDGDDRLHPTLLQRLHDIALAGNADIVACGFMDVAPGAPMAAAIKEQRVSFFDSVGAIANALYQSNINHSACGKLYRRSLCIAEPFMDGWYEDLRTFYRIFMRAAVIAYTPEPLYLYTSNPRSYLHTFTPARAVVLDVTDELTAYMAAHRPELLPAAHDRALSAAFNILNLLDANRCDEPLIAARCRATIRRYRRQSLLNPRVRVKNKLGIMLTYIGGFRLLSLVARLTNPK